MFKDQINQFACLRQIVRLIHVELGLDRELNIIKAQDAMKTGIKRTTTNNEVAFNENPLFSSKEDSFVRMNSGNDGASDLRMTTISKRRIANPELDGNVLVMPDEDNVDLQFVVQGDFFDGAEYEPDIASEAQNIAMPGETEPEEVDQDFDDEVNGVYQHPAGIEPGSPGSRQTVSTFNYA